MASSKTTRRVARRYSKCSQHTAGWYRERSGLPTVTPDVDRCLTPGCGGLIVEHLFDELNGGMDTVFVGSDLFAMLTAVVFHPCNGSDKGFGFIGNSFEI